MYCHHNTPPTIRTASVAVDKGMPSVKFCFTATSRLTASKVGLYVPSTISEGASNGS